MVINGIKQLNNYLSCLEDAQITKHEVKDIEVLSNLIFLGCNSPDDDNFQYLIFDKKDLVIFDRTFHESEIRYHINFVKEYIDCNIKNINKIVIIHDHFCASECNYNEYVKIMNIV